VKVTGEATIDGKIDQWARLARAEGALLEGEGFGARPRSLSILARF
jgi:hypothetical protein